VLTQHNRTHGITSTRPKSGRLTSNPLERADLLIAVANYEEAENVLRKAMDETPEDPELTMKLSGILH